MICVGGFWGNIGWVVLAGWWDFCLSTREGDVFLSRVYVGGSAAVSGRLRLQGVAGDAD